VPGARIHIPVHVNIHAYTNNPDIIPILVRAPVHVPGTVSMSVLTPMSMVMLLLQTVWTEGKFVDSPIQTWRSK
jgi:hypothetical protein